MVTSDFTVLKPPQRGGFFVLRASWALTLSLLYAALFALPLAAQPKLILPEGSFFDFGDIMKGSRPVHTLALKNSGDDTLNIFTVTVQCNCSSIHVLTPNIPPGGSGVIEVTFNSDYGAGRVGKSLSIMSNDPAQKIAVVEFTANISSLLEFHPELIAFTHDEAASMTPKIVTVTNLDTTAITITSVSDSTYLVDAQGAGMKIRPGMSRTLSLTPKPIGEETRHGTVQLRSDSKRQPVVRLRYIIEGGGKPR